MAESGYQEFSLWGKTLKAMFLRFLWVILLALILGMTYLYYWKDCPIELHIPLNDTTKTYEASFKSPIKGRYYLLFIDPHSTSLQESEAFLNGIKMKVRILRNGDEYDSYITDPNLLAKQPVKRLKKTVKKYMGWVKFFKGDFYYYFFQLLEIPKQFPHKKEIVLRVEANTVDDPDDILAWAIVLQLTAWVLCPVILFYTLICYWYVLFNIPILSIKRIQEYFKKNEK